MNKNLKLPPIKKIHEVAKSPSKNLEFRYYNSNLLQKERSQNEFENKKETLLNLYNDYKEKRNEYMKIKRESILTEKEYFGNLIIIEKILRYTKIKDSIDQELTHLIENKTESEESKKEMDALDSNTLVRNLKEQNKALSKELQTKEAELTEITVSNKGERYMNMTQIFLNNENDIESFKFHYNNLLYKYGQLVNKIVQTEQQSYSDKKELNKFKIKCETFLAKNEKIEIHNSEMRNKNNTLGRSSSLPEIKMIRHNEIDRLNKTLDDTCSISESKEETISKKTKENETLKKNIENLKKKCEGLSKQLSEVKTEYSNEAFAELNNLKENIKKKNQKLKEKKKKIQDTRKALATQLETNNDHLANLEKEKIQLQSLEDLLKEEEQKNKNLENEALKNKDTIIKLEQELQELENQI